MSGAAETAAAPARRPTGFYVAAATVFACSVLITGAFLRSMCEDVEMPGGWSMSMMWMVMPGQTRLTAALAFLAMWEAMMVAMMLPSTAPMLLLQRRLLAYRGETRLGLHTAAAGIGYFVVWLAFGVIAFAGGAALAEAAVRWERVSRAVPLATGIALITAGVYQLTPWKLACLRHCRSPVSFLSHHAGSGLGAALRLGIHHGAFCAGCCWGLMLIQLALGSMNVALMVAVAVIIALEKLLPRGELVARAAGVVAVAAGLVMGFRSV